MRSEEAKAFVRRHIEDFVNRQEHSAADYQEHGIDVPPGLPPVPDHPKQYPAAAFRRFPDIRVTIEDIFTEAQQKIRFGRIVILRIAAGKLAERWAYLQHPVH